jgi:TatA/E family protein of Tat protein translocase
MLSIILFISGGEIFVILLFILIFFGADKIPEFARMMGKGVREFRKATDDIKREFNSSSSSVMADIQSIKEDMTDTLTGEITEPIRKTAAESASAIEETYKNPYSLDYYYDNQEYGQSSDSEYAAEMRNHTAGATTTATDSRPTGGNSIQPEAVPANNHANNIER